MYVTICTVLLILASQRIETAAGGIFWGAHTTPLSRRGAPPSLVEWLILAWVSGTLFLYFSTMRVCVVDRTYLAYIPI